MVNVKTLCIVTSLVGMLFSGGCMVDLPDPDAPNRYPCDGPDDCQSGYFCVDNFCSETPAGDPAGPGDEPAPGDPTAGDPTSGDPASGDPASGDPTAGDPIAGDPSRCVDHDSDTYYAISGECPSGNDCNDNDSNTFPGAAPNDSTTHCMRDVDGDDYGDSTATGTVVAGTDCDDADINTFPGAAANDSTTSCMQDTDGDDFGNDGPASGVNPGSDCDDSLAAVNPAATELCYDTLNNNCDSETDCEDASCVATVSCTPELADVPPTVTGFLDTGGAPVQVTFVDPDTELPANTRWECRSAPTDVVGGQSFAACDGGTGLNPWHNVSHHSGPVEGGSYRTQVRYRFPDDSLSAVISYDYYIHNSLNYVGSCNIGVTDDALFAAGAVYLDDWFNTPPAFASSDLTPPTISIPFSGTDCYVTNYAARFQSNRDCNATETLSGLSLRRRFTLNGSDTLLLITRRYPSRLYPSEIGCYARVLKTHDCVIDGTDSPPDSVDCGYHVYPWTDDYSSRKCHAIVINSAGAGACLRVDSPPTITLEWRIDHMFEKLTDTWRLGVNKIGSFSPKTQDAGQAGGNVLYVPD